MKCRLPTIKSTYSQKLFNARHGEGNGQIGGGEWSNIMLNMIIFGNVGRHVEFGLVFADEVLAAVPPNDPAHLGPHPEGAVQLLIFRGLYNFLNFGNIAEDRAFPEQKDLSHELGSVLVPSLPKFRRNELAERELEMKIKV